MNICAGFVWKQHNQVQSNLPYEEFLSWHYKKLTKIKIKPMKKLLLLSALFCIPLFSYGQIWTVAYTVEIDEATGYYDCKAVILEGSASTVELLTQFNSSFTVVVPTGTSVSLIESFNPLINNTSFASNIPADWNMTNFVISPMEQPESDYYSFSPSIAPLANYNPIDMGEKVTLFRISADVTCNLDVRPLDHIYDAINIGPADYSNGFTIGSTNQVYYGNELPSTIEEDFIVNESSFIACVGECVTITPDVVCAPTGLAYSWSTGETTESITVCPSSDEVYDITVSGPEGLMANSSVTVVLEENIIGFDDVDYFCVGASYLPYSEYNGTWSTDNPAVANFDGNTLFINEEGSVTISITTPAGCITELEITTTPAPVINFEGLSTICIGGTTQLTPNTGTFWTTDNPSIATVDNSGNVTGVGAGTTYPTVTDLSTGCFTTTSDIPITVLSEPFIENIGSDILCIGETTLIASADQGTWESHNPNIASIDNSGTVTALSHGLASFTFTVDENGCTSTYNDIFVSPPPATSIGSETNLCIGESTLLTPLAGGTWVSTDNDVATITNGLVTGVAAGTVQFIFTSATTGCPSEPSDVITVENCSLDIALQCTDVTEVICDMDILNGTIGLMPQEDSGGVQPNPLCPSGGGAHNISWLAFVAPEGNYSVTITPYNCSDNSGYAGVQAGLYTDCTFTEPIYCNPNCSTDPITFESDGSGAGQDSPLESGEAYYFFIDGCAGSFCEYEITITGSYISQCDDPCEDTEEAQWARVPAGEFNNDYNIATFGTAPNLLAVGGLDHLVFYDYNTGNIHLKENNGNGYLDNEILLYQNEDHYGNGRYQIYLEDIDSDGLTDIILTESGIVTTNGEIGDRLTVLQNLGGGDFVRQINEQVCGMEGPDNLEIADFDNDGMKDIFFVCTDYLYDILWINDWDDTELSNFNAQTFCHTYIGDFNKDGFQDIGLNDGFALIYNGNRTFETQTFIAYEAGCSGLTYFVEESNTILDPYFGSTIIDLSSLETEFCSDHYFGDNENEIFRAYITSPDIESLVIPQIEGFYIVDPTQECNFIEGIEISSVAARENTKIDLTLNGCTDFLVIEAGQIFAWINPKQSNKILGTAFIDQNENGIYDNDELPLRNVHVSISPGDISILTDDEGNYKFSVPEGEYSLTATVSEGEWTQNELSILDIQISDPCNDGYNFGFVPIPTVEETANISMVNTIARCDFETRFTITVENTGSEPLDGVLVFSFDDETTFFSTEFELYQLIGNTLSANIGPLEPFMPQSYKVKVKMPSGSANLPMLDFNAKLYDKFGEVIEEYGYSDQLRCSYDPNDKREFPDREGDDNLTLMDEDLEYTIRFQNNGNDTAFLVKIVDPLDPNIEPSSIRVMSASHDVETCIEGTDLIFLFEDILLVDSTTNYEASQGYVTFRCNAKEGRAEFTEVNNKADIIFDTNDPIITNQTINTLVSELCTDKETMMEVTICEGDIYNGHTEAGVYTELFELPYGCDSVVTLILEVQGITYTQQNFDVCEGESVTVLGTIYDITEDVTIIDTMINGIGCISNIITFEINAVTDILGDVDDIALCVGELSTVDPDLEGSWISNDESIITIDEDGTISTIGSGSTTLTFLDDEFGCSDDLPVTVFSEPILENIGTDQICISDSTIITSDVDGTWLSDNAEVAVVNEENVVVGLTPGIANFIFTNEETGCTAFLSIEVLPASDESCTVSTNDLDTDLVKLYPNPASEAIYIETNEIWESIRIIDIDGRLIEVVKQSKSSTQEINVTQYLSGVYMIVFQDGERSLTKRFVVK